MPADVTPITRVVLRREGVCVLVEVAGSGVPAIVHWGADLGELTAADAAEIALAGVGGSGANEVDNNARLAVLPEAWTGWMGRPGISGSRAGRAWTPQFGPASVRLGSADVTEGFASGGGEPLEVSSADPDSSLEVVVTMELTAGGLLRTQVRLTNAGADDYTLNDLVIAYPVEQQARELLDFAGRWSKERTPQRRELVVGTHLREGRKGRTGPDAATVLHLGTPGFSFADGEIWAVHTGWSGNHTHYAERLFTGAQVIGGGELLLPGELVLEPGSSYVSPWVYGAYGNGLDAIARRFHRFLRARERPVDRARPVTINVWEAVYFDHDIDRLIDLARRAAELGVERYVLDDGWFGARRNDRAGLGDWTVSSDVWPDGLHPLVDAVVGHGMQFGLWFEPEMINLDSDVARAHPEWVLQPAGRLPIEARQQQVINLGIEECYTYVRDAMVALLEEYAISYIKWDHNRDLVDAGTWPDGRPGVHNQTIGFYRLLDELRERFPALEIESCSSGGARVDLGVLQRTDRIWVSDCIDPLERLQMNRWTTQLVPPEYMGSHIASGRSHTTGRVHDVGFRAASALFGHLGIEWDLAQASPAELAQLREWIAFYKEHRELLLGGDLVRMDFPDQSLMGHGVVAPDRSRALFAYAAAGRSEVASLGRLRMPGLDPERRYRVRPAVVGEGAHGLRPAAWWRMTPGPVDEIYGRPRIDSSTPAEGVVLTGAALASAGLMSAAVDPEQIVLLRADGI